MANETVNQCATKHCCKQQGGIPAAAIRELFSTSVSVGASLHLAKHIAIVAEWVTSARQLIERLEMASDRNPTLNDCLQSHDIHLSRAIWDEEQNEALEHLFCEQISHLSSALNLVDGMPKLAKEVCNV